MSILLSLLLACTGGNGNGGGTQSTLDDTGSTSTLTDGGTAVDGGTESDGGTQSDGGTEPPPPPEMSTSLSGSVLDPLRGTAVELSAQIQPMGVDVVVDVQLTDADGNVVVDLGQDLDPVVDDSDSSIEWVQLSWDGRDADGVPLAVGTYTVTLTLQDGPDSVDVIDSQSHDLTVVRTGLLSGRWGGSKRDDDVRVPLLWYKSPGGSPFWNDGAAEDAFRLDGISTGEGAEESATVVPAVWDDLEAPPPDWTDVNLPVGYQYDSHPVVTLFLGTDLGDAATTSTWTASAEGWELIDGSVADGTLVFARSDALGSSIGIVDDELLLTLSADDQPVMTQAVPYRAYGLMGPATFASGESPDLAWVSAVDQALRGLDGVEATDSAVLSALVEWVYNEAELRYDTRSGASFYMSYSGSWDRGSFNFRSFLDRTNGEIVNCSDCTGIVGVFANMLGVPLDYSIILSNFSLNEIKAIGVDDYTSCPFGPSGCGFSYHAVTTNDLSSTIWDATLQLDGDKDPGSEPWTELMVQEISGAEYLQRLVRSGSAGYYYDDSRVRVQ